MAFRVRAPGKCGIQGQRIRKVWHSGSENGEVCGTRGQGIGKFEAVRVRGLGSDSCLLLYETLGKVITFTELRLPQ